MTYQIVAIPMALSDSQGHSRIAGLFKCNFSHRCAAVDKISFDIAWSLCDSGAFVGNKVTLGLSYVVF